MRGKAASWHPFQCPFFFLFHILKSYSACLLMRMKDEMGSGIQMTRGEEKGSRRQTLWGDERERGWKRTVLRGKFFQLQILSSAFTRVRVSTRFTQPWWLTNTHPIFALHPRQLGRGCYRSSSRLRLCWHEKQTAWMNPLTASARGLKGQCYPSTPLD